MGSLTATRPCLPVLHPANLLLAWSAAVLVFQRLDAVELPVLGGGVVLAAAIWAPTMMLLLVRRIRWVLVTLAILFLWMTPGVYAPGVLGTIGITQEGGMAAGEHLLRLLAVVALLALLLSRLSMHGIVAGLYCLLRPLACAGLDRRRIAVRLMLTLDLVSQKRKISWREWLSEQVASQEEAMVFLHIPPWRQLDTCLCLGLIAMSVIGG